MTRLLLCSLVTLLLALGGPAYAGGYEQQWAQGSVILTSGDTIDGPVIYHHDEETLEVRFADGTARTFPAVNVSYFVVSDESMSRGVTGYNPLVMYTPQPMRPGMWPGTGLQRPGFDRRDKSPVKLYVTYMWDRDNDYSDFRAPAFFQQLTDGPVRLLKREKLVQRTVNPADPYFRTYGYPMGGNFYTEIQNSYFLADPQGMLTPLRTVKKDLLAYFGRHAKQIQAYAKDNKLSFTDPDELPLILNYADSLGAG
ncbi:MAG: hypothetical protein H7330_02150 [Hymenobacteraceae bacterium]|nr:hypothetical protein [Hymenobacteraceae bacterium]